MSRVDAAWKRASGDIVGEAPAPAVPRPPAVRAPEPVVRAPESMRARTPTPAVPNSLAGKLVSSPEMDARCVEQYKRLAATLHERQTESAIKSLTITSALPSEGKTLTITNLALTFGNYYGRRVLIVDADLHRPSIHEMFGIRNDRGLVDALRSSGSSLPAIQVSRNVSVVPAGLGPETAGAALSSDRLRSLVEEAATQYDWILFDTPPVAMLSDAQFVARATDGILFVIAAGVTPYAIVQRSLSDLGPDRVVGTVLNRVDGRVLPVSAYYHAQYSSRT
jgi:capsular exopolysaccharide synthesis family protein